VKRGFLAVLLVLLASTPPAAASELHPTLPEIEHEVMCPTCKTLLELSHAPVADRMRAFIRTRIAAGDSKSAIEASLVREFGSGVLAAPPKRGFGLLAWLLPLLGGAVASLTLLAVARTWSRDRSAVGEAAEPLDAPSERRLDEALAAYDD
jgi:cytochrome c-type biogenesis protein CcmH/NrfF